MKINYYCYLLPICMLLFSCQKEEQLNIETEQVLKLDIKGYIIQDTLEFVLKDQVICTAIDNTFTMNGNLFHAGKVQVLKKSDSKLITEFDLAQSPFTQTKKVFYDGTTLSDNVELTPVSKPENMGFRLRFSTSFKPFYGGPVDVELYILTINYEPFEITRESVKVINGVTSSFGEFIELPELPVSDLFFRKYQFKVYKSGTTQLPYTDEVDLSGVGDPENIFGDLESFTKGDSQLLSISPYKNDEFTQLGDGYQIQDFSYSFK